MRFMRNTQAIDPVSNSPANSAMIPLRIPLPADPADRVQDADIQQPFDVEPGFSGAETRFSPAGGEMFRGTTTGRNT
jgi:hypothetical protein